ncbi:outer membrane beta-barrel protein [Christiangramia sp. SM2212]|uniref:Outer membrane beta-barrel protein n=1 Tax=Christiangramia sediminicola TaxID=3073267 RepID=A0ABU1ELQ3_9FLAO|nr:outer membrane beta-barrel protein [Christiangramia sp. SM2212]MDR5589325.1 outer membrane beta-barrel protein [Christiangramia sp. SM2212]
MANRLRLNLNPKKILFIFIFLSTFVSQAQEYSAGIKGGLNYSLNDNGSEIVRNGTQLSAESDFGFQAGVFFEFRLGKFMLRPEAFYHKANGIFEFPDSPTVYSLEKISVPLLLGYNIFDSVDIFAGPAYQHILDKNIEEVISPLINDHSNIAAQAGFKFDLNRLQIDLRYDFTLPSKDYQRVNFDGDFNTSYFDEGRLNQVMLNINYKLFGSNINSGRRRGNCFN